MLQEGTSILENLHELGVPIPTVLARRIERIKEVFWMKGEINTNQPTDDGMIAARVRA